MLDGYTEEDLKGLSAAERAILEGDDDDGESIDDLNDLAGDGDTDADDDAEAGDAAGADEEDADEPAAVQYAPQTPVDAAQTRTDLEARKDDAFMKLMDGEIDAAEYQKVEKEVQGDLEKLLQASITDNVTATLAQAQAAQAWGGEVKALMKAAAAEGLDYKGDAALKKELDGLVRVFGAEAMANSMDDVGLKASKWALEQAHAVMKVRHGKAATTAPEPAAKSKGREAPDLSKIPPNLGKIPVAADATGGSDEFAHLGALNGAALERALAKMTPEQQDRYLA